MRRPTRLTNVGDFIGAVFGLVFIIVNSSALPGWVRIALIVVAALATLIIAGSFGKAQAHRKQNPDAQAPGRFSNSYWVIVAVEVLALAGGIPIVLFVQPAALLGWIALVVGAHFIAFSIWWLRNEAGVLFIGITLAVHRCGRLGHRNEHAHRGRC